MSQSKPHYEELDEFIQIANRLIDLYPSVFPSIDPNKIAAIQITNKSRPPKRQQLWDMKPIQPPITLFCPKQFIVTLYSDDWDGRSENSKAAIVSDVLFSIDPKEEAKVVPFDKKDHGVMLRTL